MTNIEKFNNQKILIIGDIMLDTYIFGNVERISPEAPVPVVSIIKRDNRPGGAANVALNAVNLGATPYLCGCIGDDDKAEVLLHLMKSHNINTVGIICDNSRPTTTKFRIIGNSVQMLRVDEESAHQLSVEKTKILIEKVISITDTVDIDCIIFQDYDKGVICLELIEKVVSIAKEKNIPVAVDPKKRNYNNYKNVTLFKPNYKEFKESGKSEELSRDNIEAMSVIMKNFCREKNIEQMMLTLGDGGILMVLKEEHSCFHIPAHLRQVSDVSGAGDTVIAVSGLCLSAGLSPYKMAEYCNLAGGLVCQYVGVVPLNKQEFIDELKRLNL